MKEIKFKFIDLELNICCGECKRILNISPDVSPDDPWIRIKMKDIYLNNLEVQDFIDIIVIDESRNISTRNFKYFDFEHFKKALKKNNVCKYFLNYLLEKDEQFDKSNCYVHRFFFHIFLEEQLHNYIHENKCLPSDWKQFLIDCLKKAQEFYKEWTIEKEENIEKIAKLCRKELLKHKI